MNSLSEKFSLTRRKFLDVVGQGAAYGALFALLGKAVYEPGETAMEIVGLNPELLRRYGEQLHFGVVWNAIDRIPEYPVGAVAANHNYVPLAETMRDAVARAVVMSGKNLKLVWKSPEYTDYKEVASVLPRLDNYYSFNRIEGLPETTQEMLGWSTNPIFFLDEIALPFSTFTTNLVTAEIKSAVAKIHAKTNRENNALANKMNSGEINAEQFDAGYTFLIKQRNLDIGAKTAPIGRHFEEVRGHVEAERRKTKRPVFPSEVIGYYLLKNQGLFEAIADALVFFKLAARNDFKTGAYLSDEIGAKENLDWMRINIQDTSALASWNLMPDSYELYSSGYDQLLKIINSRGDMDMEETIKFSHNFRVINMLGTLYHILNGLLLCGMLPWPLVALGNINRTDKHGDLKLAREANGVSEFPDAVAFLSRFAKR